MKIVYLWIICISLYLLTTSFTENSEKSYQLEKQRYEMELIAKAEQTQSPVLLEEANKIKAERSKIEEAEKQKEVEREKLKNDFNKFTQENKSLYHILVVLCFAFFIFLIHFLLRKTKRSHPC
ncbi:hypothetical protein EGK75_13510 [Neisseria weixii]|uniref:Uncharacterized protein n=1 Tax=Neisseria weixii TaxID=1853276 RepID=A0A3N4MV80_9NEIS|nr:hypothetical protein [Neisseria weixii]RPD83109.1 hypothetical protein EGK74_13485 [Neisseria weixii]RPD83265.1 hypothetical protein EGK75_13510 [Neisseria weixii]